jgi:hypothetical protein
MVQKLSPSWHGADALMPPLLLRQALPQSLCRHWLDRTATQDRAARLVASVLPMAPVLQAVAASALRGPIEQALGPAPLCNLDQSWIRHGQPAHSWHQDGALHFDFMAHAQAPAAPDALLEMLTCWIALTPCGVDAPGLEWVDAPHLPLLQPSELTEQAVQARLVQQRGHAVVRPALQAGDALLFDGALLHRTHVTPSPSKNRTSLELRFFRADAWPARLGSARRHSL